MAYNLEPQSVQCSPEVDMVAHKRLAQSTARALACSLVGAEVPELAGIVEQERVQVQVLGLMRARVLASDIPVGSCYYRTELVVYKLVVVELGKMVLAQPVGTTAGSYSSIAVAVAEVVSKARQVVGKMAGSCCCRTAVVVVGTRVPAQLVDTTAGSCCYRIVATEADSSAEVRAGMMGWPVGSPVAVVGQEASKV